jgi:hypothetical protein
MTNPARPAGQSRQELHPRRPLLHPERQLAKEKMGSITAVAAALFTPD